MHDGMQYDPIQGQGHEHFTVRNLAIFKSYLHLRNITVVNIRSLLCHLQWELASDH